MLTVHSVKLNLANFTFIIQGGILIFATNEKNIFEANLRINTYQIFVTSSEIRIPVLSNLKTGRAIAN